MKEITLPSNHVVLIDDSDAALVSLYPWYYSEGYAKQYYPNQEKTVRAMHNLFLPVKEGFDVDHVDGNKLNNQRSNLRYCTRSQNMGNCKAHKDSKFGIKGVCYQPRSQKRPWYARIMVNGKHIYLGSFKTHEEAEAVYEQANKQYFPVG
jgi:hypothetical protein